MWPHQVKWWLIGQTVTSSTVQDCVATFVWSKEITNLKKAPQMLLNSTSCQNVYDVFLAMYSTELNVTNVRSNF